MEFSNLPVAVHFFTEQIHTSENAALKEAVLSFKPAQTDVVRVFDRGITSRKTYDELIVGGIPFVSRLNVKSKHEAYIDNQLPQPIKTATLAINSDSLVYLFKDKCVRADHPLRCINAIRIEDGQEITFITNIND